MLLLCAQIHGSQTHATVIDHLARSGQPTYAQRQLLCQSPSLLLFFSSFSPPFFYGRIRVPLTPLLLLELRRDITQSHQPRRAKAFSTPPAFNSRRSGEAGSAGLTPLQGVSLPSRSLCLVLPHRKGSLEPWISDSTSPYFALALRVGLPAALTICARLLILSLCCCCLQKLGRSPRWHACLDYCQRHSQEVSAFSQHTRALSFCACAPLLCDEY